MISFITLLVSGSVYAADTCQAVFRSHGPLLDNRYGKASQNHEYFYLSGLIPTDGSQLCGPTCLYNALEKFHNVDGIPSPMWGPRRIEDLVEHIFPNGDRLVSKGAPVFDVANAMVRALKEENIAAKVRLFTSVDRHPEYSGSVTADVLRDSLRDDTIVIAALGRYHVHDPRNARASRRNSGHYVIIAGYHPDHPSEFYVIDPMSPRRFRQMLIKKVKPDAFAEPTYAVYFTDQREGPDFVLIEELITARRKR